MRALERAKRVQAALTKLVERRERLVQRASAEFRLDLLAAIDAVDDETLALVQRGLAMDRGEQELQLALQLAIDERNARRQCLAGLVEVAREGELVTLDRLTRPPSLATLEGDEDDLTEIDDVPAYANGARRYPEPGEAAVELPDGTVVAAS